MQDLTQKYRPSKIADFAGLDRVRAIMTHVAENPYESVFLLLGDSGLGKTAMAFALAKQINAEVTHIAAKECTMERVGEVVEHCHYLPMFGEQWHVVICDEFDTATPSAQVAFLSILDGTNAPSHTIWIFTANSTAKLQDRLVSRCRVLKFSTEGMTEPAVQLLTRVWKSETNAPLPDIRSIVADAKCNIRMALMELELCLIAARTEPQPPKRKGYWLGKTWVIQTA